MRYLKAAMLVALAVLLSAQLVLHNHSLVPVERGAPTSVCPVCAFGADRVTLVSPAVALPPMVAVWTVEEPVADTLPATDLRSASSRGPPNLV